jgi:hypothetical protein
VRDSRDSLSCWASIRRRRGTTTAAHRARQGFQQAAAPPPPAASLMDSFPGQQPRPAGGPASVEALLALEHPRPQLELALGPQEVEVRR